MALQYQIAGGTARELETSVEDGIRAGGLGPGAALPTVRGLASHLGVSPATVASAYRELRRRAPAPGSGPRRRSAHGLRSRCPRGCATSAPGAPTPRSSPPSPLSPPAGA